MIITEHIITLKCDCLGCLNQTESTRHNSVSHLKELLVRQGWQFKNHSVFCPDHAKDRKKLTNQVQFVERAAKVNAIIDFIRIKAPQFYISDGGVGKFTVNDARVYLTDEGFYLYQPREMKRSFPSTAKLYDFTMSLYQYITCGQRVIFDDRTKEHFGNAGNDVYSKGKILEVFA